MTTSQAATLPWVCATLGASFHSRRKTSCRALSASGLEGRNRISKPSSLGANWSNRVASASASRSATRPSSSSIWSWVFLAEGLEWCGLCMFWKPRRVGGLRQNVANAPSLPLSLATLFLMIVIKRYDWTAPASPGEYGPSPAGASDLRREDLAPRASRHDRGGTEFLFFTSGPSPGAQLFSGLLP